MAAQIALATAIVVALGILIALVWNTLKRRWHGADGHAASPSARRSLDSVERLIQDRMRNRPPPYETAEADKPPTYENSFSDPCTPPQFDVPDWIRPPSSPTDMTMNIVGHNQRTVSYENQAFVINEVPPLPSVSAIVDEGRPADNTRAAQDAGEFSVHL